jgi:S-adenosylmethionine:tRNA ribosyltransferase-isomerase
MISRPKMKTHLSKPHLYNLESYNYTLPEAQIAQEPLLEKNSAKLMIYRTKENSIQHSSISNLENEIPSNTLIILNNSRVIPARVEFFAETGGKREIFILATPKIKTPHSCVTEALLKPSKKFSNENITLPGNLRAKILQQTDNKALIEFFCSLDDFRSWLNSYGSVPLPPYIKRKTHSLDQKTYQTEHSREDGSVACPTAGLHISGHLYEKLKSKGICFAEITLHVGLGTFLPVSSENIKNHHMHKEQFFVPRKTLDLIIKYKKENRPIINIGTTSLRCLESLYKKSLNSEKPLEEFADMWLETDLFIYPQENKNYTPWACNALMTNFHQPKSTLLMLIASLLGKETTFKLYEEALALNYRFLSYGDSSLLWL